MTELEEKHKQIIVKTFGTDGECQISDIISKLTEEECEDVGKIITNAIDENILEWGNIDNDGNVSVLLGWEGENIYNKLKKEVTDMNYEDTTKDIEETLGIVPGFMEALPQDVLIQEWPIFKKYIIRESEIPAKYRAFIGLAIAASVRCSYSKLLYKNVAEFCEATDEELAEIAVITSLVARWSVILHTQQYDLETFKEDIENMGDRLQDKIEK